MQKLNPRQAAFVEEYIVDLNGTQAAIRAGYAVRGAHVHASRLLSDAKVAEAIAAKKAERSEKTGITAERVIRELALIGFANMADYMKATPDGNPYLDFSALSRDQAGALQEVTVEDYMEGRGEDAREVKRVKFKLADKRAALVDLGRHLGLFTDRVDVTSGGKRVPTFAELYGQPAPADD